MIVSVTDNILHRERNTKMVVKLILCNA